MPNKLEEMFKGLGAYDPKNVKPLPPFGITDGDPADMFLEVRDTALMVSALLQLLASYGKHRFQGAEDEATVLVAEALSRIEGLLDEAKIAHAHFDRLGVANG